MPQAEENEKEKNFRVFHAGDRWRVGCLRVYKGGMVSKTVGCDISGIKDCFKMKRGDI